MLCACMHAFNAFEDPRHTAGLYMRTCRNIMREEDVCLWAFVHVSVTVIDCMCVCVCVCECRMLYACM
jgi:hypothetical protein